MQTPLNASASTAGALLSSSTFEVPQFQREYSWQDDEVADFWNDLSNNIEAETYFLGLVILTDEDERKHVVDGQQRLITLSLLANAIYFEAASLGRKALADRIQADFLLSIDYDSDETNPRVILSDEVDNATFQHLLKYGASPKKVEADSVSERLVQSFNYLSEKLKQNLKQDPFKRLGKWTEFLTHRVYFAVFVHPDPSSAYQVYEVINTRGKELTTADLLKNYVLSQTKKASRQARYDEWQSLSRQFPVDGANTFVQYIRHAVTVRSGHIPSKDLFGFLSQRLSHAGREPPNPTRLMELLRDHFPLYAQMIDPSAAGPAHQEYLRIFSALLSLNVIAVRPILLAIAEVDDALEGMRFILKLVVRRIIVGNLGTGNVERRFGEAARRVSETQSWKSLIGDFKDLNPSRDLFIEQLKTRSFNKGVLSFMRRSIVCESITPDSVGVLHFIWTRQASDWYGMTDEDGAYWGSTIGNTFLSDLDRRPREAGDWVNFKESMLPTAVTGEWQSVLNNIGSWDAAAIGHVGKQFAKAAGEIWYG